LLVFITTPRSIDEIVEHRFVSRPDRGEILRIKLNGEA